MKKIIDKCCDLVHTKEDAKDKTFFATSLHGSRNIENHLIVSTTAPTIMRVMVNVTSAVTIIVTIIEEP